MWRVSCFKLHQPTAKYYWHGEQLQFCIPVRHGDNFSNRVEASLYVTFSIRWSARPQAIRANCRQDIPDNLLLCQRHTLDVQV